MPDPLEIQYENELTFIRRLGTEFARERPKIADRLLLDRESGASEDPHVERLIEAFAFLTARIRLKLNDEFPELTESFLETLYPHYLAPIPSMSVVEFKVDPVRCNFPQGHTIEKGSRLLTPSIRGVACEFRTTSPLTLWPLEIVSARYLLPPYGRDIVPSSKTVESKALIQLELECGGGASLSELELDKLRFFLSGDYALVSKLYELIFNHVTQVMIRGEASSLEGPPLTLRPNALQPVGFAPDEGMLPYGNRSFPGYRLLAEYFCFPSKFMFFDIEGLQGVRRRGWKKRLEVLLFLNRSMPNLEAQVRAETFRLGCCPAVNLFRQPADAGDRTETRAEYHVVPDSPRHWAMEVYSIDSVQCIDKDTTGTTDFQPFYSFKHGVESPSGAYWCQSRRPSVQKNDSGTEVYVSLVDLDFNPTTAPKGVIMIDTTCTNRDLPGELRAAGGEDWEFELLGQAPCRRISPVVQPTAPSRLPPEELRWRLISHLALNHLSITDGADGAQALREIMTLYDYAATRVTRQHIEGIASVTSRRVVAPISDPASPGFCRGIEITVEFDDDKYTGSGPFLFASILDRFLGLYATINSATRLVARSKQREESWKRWPFRSGEKPLL